MNNYIHIHEKVCHFFLIFLVLFGIIANNNLLVQAKIDWFQQQAIIYKFSQVDLKNPTVALVYYDPEGFLFNRKLHYYEYSGKFKEATGKENFIGFRDLQLKDSAWPYIQGYPELFKASGVCNIDLNAIMTISFPESFRGCGVTEGMFITQNPSPNLLRKFDKTALDIYRISLGN